MADNTEKLVTLSDLSDHIEEIKRILKQVRAFIDKKDDTKVDKVDGKGLSSNDYTAAEKNKLATLKNYDDSALVAQVKALEQSLNTLVGDNASEAIDNFNEILKFLSGITDTQTLEGMLANIRSDLQTYLSQKVDKESGKQLSTNDYTTAEKNKLAGIEAGAQKNTVTGIKGNAESSYRTGNVNLTPANIGAAAAAHTHTTDNITDFSAQVKTLQAADILSAEPTETTLTHTVNGTIINYKIGELVRVPDSESETGFKFFQLHAVTDGKAVWAALGTGSGGNIALTETVTISLGSNQSSGDSSLIGTRILIEDVTNDPAVTLLDTTWQGTPIIYKVTAATLYKVTFGDVEGYQTPDAVQYTAQLSSARNINATYNTCVVGITISGLENGATAQATVAYSGKSFKVSSGGTIKVPHGTQTTVSVPTIACHITPSAQSFTPDATSKSLSFAYVASKMLVSVLSNQTSDDTIAATKATVSYGSTSVQASNGSVVYIPHDQTVTVTFPSVTGYKTPSSVTINNTSGGQATASGTYKTEIVTVTVSAEDASSVAGQQITINGNVFTLDSTGVCTSKVPFDVQYSVSADAKSGYTSPSTQTFTASQTSRAVSMIYKTIKLGVFIQDKSGKLWTTDSWDTSNNSNANAIAVLTSNVKVLVALTDSGGTKQIHSSYSGALENYMTAISDTTQAKADYKGAENTANIMKLQSSTSYAAGWCNAFTFPDGKTKGHLPSLGEFWEVYQNKSLVDAALSKCGGTAINTGSYHWCSTFWGIYSSHRRCWLLGWSDGYVSGNDLGGGYYVRAFAAYSD